MRLFASYSVASPWTIKINLYYLKKKIEFIIKSVYFSTVHKKFCFRFARTTPVVGYLIIWWKECVEAGSIIAALCFGFEAHVFHKCLILLCIASERETMNTHSICRGSLTLTKKTLFNGPFVRSQFATKKNIIFLTSAHFAAIYNAHVF